MASTKRFDPTALTGKASQDFKKFIAPYKKPTTQGEKDELIFNPWNPANRTISDNEIVRFLTTYGITEAPRNMALYRQVFIHTSYYNNQNYLNYIESEGGTIVPQPADCMPLQDRDNQEMEFVGDSLLDCVVAIYLHERYPGEGEGFFTKLKTRIVNNEHLGELAIKIGFAPHMILSKYVDDMCQGRKNLRILGSALEAWISAMFQDYQHCCAFSKVQTWLINMLETHVDFASFISHNNNYKDQILRFFQTKFHVAPKYTEVSVGQIHDRVFTIGVLHPETNEIIVTAKSRNKKNAEQEASRRALILMGVIKKGTTQAVDGIEDVWDK